MVANVTAVHLVVSPPTSIAISSASGLVIFALFLLFFVVVQGVSDVAKLGRHSARQALQAAVSSDEYRIADGGCCILQGTLLALFKRDSEVEYHTWLDLVLVASVNSQHIFFVARANTEAEV